MSNPTYRIALLLFFVMANATVSGQSYPWRANASTLKNTPSSTISGTQIRFQRLGGQEKEAQEEPLADSQPSLSDNVKQVPPQQEAPQLPGVAVPDRVPTAPLQSGIQPNLIQPVNPVEIQGSSIMGSSLSAQPGLAVESNAGVPSNYCNRNCRKPCCLGCPKKLFGETCNGLQAGGWTTLGYHNRNTGLFNNHAGDVDIAQFWFYVDRQASRNQAGWDFGYRIDTVYGLDAQDTQAFGNSPTGAPSGWDNGWDFGRHGWALPQLYAQAANCDWDVKIGKFFSPFGYESIGSVGNFFYSRSFTAFNTDPFTLTGLLAERQVSQDRSYLLGYSTGWDTGFENNSGGNLIVGLRRQVNEFVNVSFTASAGDSGYRDTGTLTSGVTEVQLTDSLRYVLHTSSLNLRTNQEFGVVQYLFRDVNPCLGLGARLEWWKSDRFFGGATSSTYGFTMGANYRPNANVVLRPEVRWDWGALAVDRGEAIIGIDAVITF